MTVDCLIDVRNVESRPGTGRHAMGTGDGEDVAPVVAAQYGGQVWVTAVGLVAGDPPARQSAGDGGFDEAACQLWFGGEGNRVGHCGLGRRSGSSVQDFGR